MVKLPLCAACGASLVGKSRMIVEWDFPDKPKIGWGVCCRAKDDPAWQMLQLIHPRNPSRPAETQEAERARVAEALELISSRGAGRVLRRLPDVSSDQRE